jgi:hypothetical protein
MYLRFPDEMLFWMNAPARRRVFQRRNEPLEWFCAHFSIRIVCRIFDLKCRRPTNSSTIQELLSNSYHARSLLLSLRRRGFEDQTLLSYMDTPGSSAPSSPAPALTDDADGDDVDSERFIPRPSVQDAALLPKGEPTHQERNDEAESGTGEHAENIAETFEDDNDPQSLQKNQDINRYALQAMIAVCGLTCPNVVGTCTNTT